MLIEPSPEQFTEWLQDVTSLYPNHPYPNHTTGLIAAEVARLAYRDGADMELEKCCEWLSGWGGDSYGRELHDARRPKPPSLKEQALAELDSLENMGACNSDSIRRALEALPDD